MSYTFSDFVGNAGVALIIGAYLLLQMGRVQSVDFSYSLMNLVGSLLIVYSLLWNFNLSSFFIEIFWILISLYGLYRCLRARR
jgi:hypothetical protein